VLAALTTSLLVIGSVAVATPAQADGHRVAVPDAKPAWATADADSGAVAAGTPVEVELALALPDETGARAFALAVSTPGTSSYRQYLTPAAWIARFAPTQATLDTLTAAVQAAGLQIESVPKSRLFVQLTGTAAQVDSFLSTRLHAFDVDGQQRIATSGPATLPQRVARSVAAVTFTHPRISAGPAATAKRSVASTCSDHWKQHTVHLAKKAYGRSAASTPLCGVTAKQLRALTGLTSSKLDGAGQTIAVIDAFGSPSMRRDLATYSSRNGLPAADYTEVLPARTDQSYGCTAADWQPEQALDLEAMHAVAPKAKLVYVGASDCGTGFDTAMSTILDDGLASIVSNSWGSTALDTDADTDMVDDATRQSIVVMLHQQLQAAGQGVGLYYASGDFGDESELLGSPSVDFPASSPFVTAVGGTAAALDEHGDRVFTTAWGENVAALSGKKPSGTRKQTWSPSLPGTFVAGSGGGASSLFAAPAYQAGVVPASIAHGMRTSTDVSALAASSTGFLIGYRPSGPSGSYRTRSVGGTSLATPIVAAQIALSQQATGRRLGFVNPALYAVARTTPSAFRDVVPSTTRRAVATTSGATTLLTTLDRDSSLKVRRGYDLPTGLGELTPATLTALGRL
jgi:subtilase family serine protease